MQTQTVTSEAGISLYLDQLQKCAPLTVEEERSLMPLALAGDQPSVDRIISSNLRFVVKTAMEYKGRGTDLADLIAEGNLALYTALDRFDLTREVRFISYAVFWIRQAMQQAIRKSSGITYPANRHQDQDNFDRRSNELCQAIGRFPSSTEVADDLDLSTERLDRAAESSAQFYSLDTQIGGDSESTWLDLLESEEEPQDEYYERDALTQVLFDAMETCLSDREVFVLQASFGIDGDQPVSAIVLGEKMGLSRERIRQIKNGAIEKLQKELGAQK